MDEVARGDTQLITFIQRCDGIGQPLVVPSLALAGVAASAHHDTDAEDLLTGVVSLDMVTVAPLKGVEQGFRLARVTSVTGLDPWDGHVAAIADASVCPILTVDAEKWQGPSKALEHPLHIIEITEDPE
ncbi:hypothetical protein GT755_18325 [Herbidospora sp. NEAU-GS84]|uniref:PIN domain-containing protein n=1 Tax=Herbidospora solisilvae TaxID=2696284 RepID=A0A7C9JCI7_9ACTN|nr:hypothetical protein [Herbidospora solisilvae]NAS23644.1 hypothetical protein [Herbidospora solisilvae]